MPVHLEPGPDTVHWGYFDARLSPRVAIDSGERVTISSVSGGPELMPGPPLVVPPALPAIHQKVPRQLGPHILTGPVAIQDEEFRTLQENADLNAVVSLAFLIGILWLAGSACSKRLEKRAISMPSR